MPKFKQMAASMLSGNNLRQTVHTHRASDHQEAKLVAGAAIIGGTAGDTSPNILVGGTQR